mmetsp:Transcript_66562/g.138987  ORF Transcript_66562/g.138987 Transcript_66562/m.138987 type:complete len:249 (-) Transcript_66562:342-1088(-)
MPAATTGASTTLPPVTARTGSRTGSGALDHDAGPQHPFDTPYGIMQTLQADLAKLRDDLRIEQQERRAEVATLKNEISELRDIIKRDELKQQADHDVLKQNLQELNEREAVHHKHICEVTEAEFARRAMVADHQSLVTLVDSTIKDLEGTSKRFDTIVVELQKQIQANADGDSAFADSIRSELHGQRIDIDKNTAADKVFEETVMVQLRMAGHLLQSAGARNGTNGNTGGQSYPMAAKLAPVGIAGSR